MPNKYDSVGETRSALVMFIATIAQYDTDVIMNTLRAIEDSVDEGAESFSVAPVALAQLASEVATRLQRVEGVLLEKHQPAAAGPILAADGEPA